MQELFVRWTFSVVAALAFAPAILAQTPVASRDLSGLWTPRGEIDFFARPEMTAWAKEKYEAVRFGVPTEEQGLDFMDPVQVCYPTGPPRQLTLNRPFEIFHLADRVLILYEYQHERRMIYTDGRGHPPGFTPTFMGHSTGRWDGETLIVDTVGMREELWLDGLGSPLTDAMHYEERFRRLDPNTLEVSFRFEDPEAYTRPWGGKKNYELRSDWLIMEQINCEDYLRERLIEQKR